MNVWNRVLYWWGLGGLCASLGLFLLMLTGGRWAWAAFDAVLAGVNCGTLWMNARATEYLRCTRQLQQQILRTRRV